MSVFKLFKSSNDKKTVDETVEDEKVIESAKKEAESEKQQDRHIQSEISVPSKKGFISKLKSGLKKTSVKFGAGFSDILLGKKIIDDDLIDEIEMQLLVADIGVDSTNMIMEKIRGQVKRNELQTSDQLIDLIKSELQGILAPCTQKLEIETDKKPYVLLMIGINGAGKTTTIGKLAKKFKADGKSVMMAAGDTFRAAAVEQLQEWGARNDIPVVAQHTGADSASVIYDAVNAAKARGTDVIIADTAGRLHTKSNLMDELKKVVRVIKKLDETAPHEIMLVLDSGTGQNALSQAEQFKAQIGVTGITLTKMDGTAKGGIVFAISKALNIPIRFIGVGEGIDDLQPFEAQDFVEAIFDS